MVSISFGIKDKNYLIQNLIYLYMTSTVLGGFLYFLNLNFSESQDGLIFTYSEISINYLFLVITSPIMLYIYVKEQRKGKQYQHYYQVLITYQNGEKQMLSSYLDTGNKLVDPITKKKIILVSENKVKDNTRHYLYVPYHSLNHEGLMKCIKIRSIEINGHVSKDYLVGISEGNLIRDGIDCVLNSYCLEELL